MILCLLSFDANLILNLRQLDTNNGILFEHMLPRFFLDVSSLRVATATISCFAFFTSSGLFERDLVSKISYLGN